MKGRPKYSMGKKGAKKCSTAGKKKYRTRLDCLLDYANAPRKTRAYCCPSCGYWHAATVRGAPAR